MQMIRCEEEQTVTWIKISVIFFSFLFILSVMLQDALPSSFSSREKIASFVTRSGTINSIRGTWGE